MAKFDETFDWVVVGSGAGSVSSALLMKHAGKSVVILEKSDKFGGTTAKSGGVIWIPNNRFMDPGEDSEEKAITYLDSVVKDSPKFPGTSPQKRRTFVREGPKMIDFVVGQGVALERCSRFWPDYYDELPGGNKTSRTISAVPFNKKELPGDWADKLRLGMLEMPVRLDDGMQIANMNRSWAARGVFAKTAARVVMGKLTGKHWVSAGAALQGRMLKAILEKNAADIRLNSPVKEIILDGDKALTLVQNPDPGPDRKPRFAVNHNRAPPRRSNTRDRRFTAYPAALKAELAGWQFTSAKRKNLNLSAGSGQRLLDRLREKFRRRLSHRPFQTKGFRDPRDS